MAYEVELKAHIQAPDIIKRRIMALSGIDEGYSEHKADIYWTLPSQRPLFRVRETSTGPIDAQPCNGSIQFTRKDKQLQGAIEVNHEIEFSAPLEDAQAIHQFCVSLGYEEYIRKEKNGWAWNLKGQPTSVHIELVDIPSLGWFLEMECILEAEALADQAKALLLQTLDALDVPRSAIEEHYYMDLLKDLS